MPPAGACAPRAARGHKPVTARRQPITPGPSERLKSRRMRARGPGGDGHARDGHRPDARASCAPVRAARVWSVTSPDRVAHRLGAEERRLAPRTRSGARATRAPLPCAQSSGAHARGTDRAGHTWADARARRATGALRRVSLTDLLPDPPAPDALCEA